MSLLGAAKIAPYGALPQSSTVQHLIHTGLEPGDRRLEEICETVLTVSSASWTTKL